MKTKDPLAEAKHRKFLLVLPFLTIPFIVLLLWGLGVETKEGAEKSDVKSKVNMALPEASFEKTKPQDKMSFYTQAALDSVKRNDQSKLDPYFSSGSTATGPDVGFNSYGSQGLNQSPYGIRPYADPNEAKIYSKLGELNSVLNQQPSPTSPSNYINGATQTVNNGDLDRLESMMNMMQGGNLKGDPEMQQINGMLEKILDIQNPDRAQEKINLAKNRNRGQIYAVTGAVDENPITILGAQPKLKKTTTADFYGIDEATPQDQENTIAAVVHSNQTIVSGSIVKLRLLNDVMVRGELIPKDNFVFGQAQITGERLNIEIKSIRYNNSIYPVALSVYDLDGMDGIHIPGSISRDMGKEQGTDVIQGLGMNSLDPTLATQAASAGIELSKNLLKRKVKLVKVSLKAGYKLLLKDDKSEIN